MTNETRNRVGLIVVLALAMTMGWTVSATAEEELQSIQLIKLRIIDQDDKPVAQLVVPDGEMGSIYFGDKDKQAVGLVPRCNADGDVEISVYRVQRVAEDEQVAELVETLKPLARGARQNISVADLADLKVEFIDTKMVTASAEVR